MNIMRKEMSFGDELLFGLMNYHDGYKLMRARMKGYSGPADLLFKESKKEIKKRTLQTTLWRLKRLGLIKNENRIVLITEKGKEYIQAKLTRKRPAHAAQIVDKKRKINNLIIAFDVPEKYRYKRDWLREELSCLGFNPIQKSVWFGPGPVTKEFIVKINELDLLSCMKFFSAKETEIV